jgi:hypothetical protein
MVNNQRIVCANLIDYTLHEGGYRVNVALTLNEDDQTLWQDGGHHPM